MNDVFIVLDRTGVGLFLFWTVRKVIYECNIYRISASDSSASCPLVLTVPVRSHLHRQ